MTATVYYSSQLPWDSAQLENGRFSKILIIILLLTACFGLWVSWVQLPEIPREEKEAIPPQLARIIEAQPLEEPVPVEPEPEPEPELIEEPEEEPIPEPEIVEEVEPEPVVEPTVEPPKEPDQDISEETKIEQARETAKSKGVLAFSDTLASMRQSTQLQNLANTEQTTGGGQTEVTQRKRIASDSVVTSGGVDTSDISSNIGAAGELAGRRTTEFAAASEGQASLATKRIETTTDVIGSRDLDKIRQVLDANKGAVYALYRRALRKDPSIEGKLTVKLVIEPSGALSAVTLISSELDAEDLVQKLLKRIRLINFGEANVTQTQLEYAYNFLPY